MQRSMRGKMAWWGLMVAAIAVVGFAVAEPGVVSAGFPTAVPVASAAPAAEITSAALSWSPSELRAAATTLAPYTEPGYDLTGATYLGAPDLATSVNPTGTIDLLIALQFSNNSRLNALLPELSDPSSPEYHHYLTEAQFNEAFGGVPSVYNSLVNYLQSFGVTGLTTQSDRLSLTFEATPAQVSSIFHTELGSFVSASGQPYYAPLSLPSIPAPLAPYIIEVEGLSDYSQYLNHVAPLVSTTAIAQAVAASEANAAHGPTEGAISPGTSQNPFASTTVTSNGLTLTYDQPVVLNSKGKTGTKPCDSTTCGDLVEAPDLQVTYNETGLFEKYGYPVGATVAAILWSDAACYSSSKPTSACGSDDFYNYWCTQHVTSGEDAWDFFMPDVTSFWNYSIPAGEPMPHAYSMAIASGYTYAYPSGSNGFSASCDDDEAQGENTLDVSMLGSMAPGANVIQTFAGSSTTTAITTVFSDLLSPSTSDYSTDGGFDTASTITDMENVSVITNSWTTGSGTSSLGTAWASDLKTAQARGITVLGATGDSGTTVEAPAATTSSAFGTVAVGGTTAAINATTLQRGAPHLASNAAPYYGVGTGEIGWYEPDGTVDGFTSTYGGTGGVASTTTFPRGSFTNNSADAAAVCNAVKTGNYRCEPDIASIANDTIINLEVGPYSLNFTCWVSSSCKAVSPLDVGTTSGSSPTVAGTYFIGTSIATQVTGGVIATIDYALHKSGQGWLGFLDPSAYAMGQKQDTSDLTLHSFYDVNTYTDADGLVANYEAKTGFDLATGWGVIDAGNYTANTLTYASTFSESGLPSGTSWSVVVTPTLGDAGCTISGSSCSNPSTVTGTTASLSASDTFGKYTYTASATGYSAPGGTFYIHGAGNSITVVFSELFASPSATPNPSYVGGGAVTISAGASGGSGTYTTYAWSGLPAACGAPGNVATFTCTPTAAGTSTVSVTVTDSNGGEVTGSFSWVVYSTLGATASASVNPVDEGQSTTISAIASGGSGGYGYSWSGLPAGCGVAEITSSFSCTPASGASAGSPYTVSVLVTDSNGGHTTASFSLVVDPALSAGTVSATPNPVDTGEATELATSGASGGSGTYSYAWSGLPTGCASSNAASITCVPTAPGTYVFELTVTDGNGAQATASASVSVNNVLGVSASATVNPVDEGQATTISAVAGGGSGGYTYAWSGLPSGCGSPGDVASFACTPAPGDAAGSPYTVTVQVTDSLGSGTSGQFTLVVDPALSVGPSANVNPVDSGQTTTISANAAGGSGTYSYVWSGLPGTCSAGNTASFDCTPGTAGTYTVGVQVTDGNGATASGSFQLVVNGALTVSASATVNPVEEGQATTISAVAGGGSGGDSYAWSGLPSGCGSPGDVASFSCTPAVGDSDLSPYTVSVTVEDSASTQVTTSFQLDVEPILNVGTVTFTVNPVDVGQTTTISVSVSGGSGAGTYSYSWSGLPSGCGSPGDVASFVCTPAAGDVSGSPYTVDVTVTDASGNPVSATPGTLVVYPALSAAPSATPNPLDVGQTTTVAANAAGGSGTYGYTWGGLAGSGCAGSGASFSCAPTQAGTYTVWVNVTDGTGAYANVSFSLVVDSAVSAGTAGATPNPVTVDTATTIGTTGASGGAGGYTYAWSGLPSSCSAGDVASFSCTPSQVGAYTVELTVTDANGEAATSTFTLTVNPVGTYQVTFTETGLPAGTSWTVHVSGGTTLTGTTTTLSADLVNGAYTYTVSSANTEYAAAGGTFTVASAAVGVTVAFHQEKYSLTYTETGIPAKKLAKVGWTVEVNGTVKSATTATITFTGLTNGSYSLLILGPNGYRSSVASGSQTVAGTTGVSVAFAKGSTAVLSFHEKGLPKKTSWCVAVDGDSVCSTTGVVKFAGLTPGSYAFVIESPTAGYTITTTVGKTPVTSPITLTKSTAVTVKFKATGSDGTAAARGTAGLLREEVRTVSAAWAELGAVVAVASALALVGAAWASRRGGAPGAGSEA